MTSIVSSNICICLHGDPGFLSRSRNNSRLESYRYSNVGPLSSKSGASTSSNQNAGKVGPLFSSALDDPFDPDDSKDGNDSDQSPESDTGEVNDDILRQNLERSVGSNDTTFSGTDLATLIRKKYGRSYDVQLIKKEFMGKNLLALNVMWKYMEQAYSFSIAAFIELLAASNGMPFNLKTAGTLYLYLSFPLSEEEYLLRLDDVANTLKCWGAVSHIRNSLEKLKERPRIGKAVSIFIDMDETGGRANEWIYK